MFSEILTVIIATMMPISELRGSIPIGLALGLPANITIPIAFIINCLIFFPIYFGLELFYEKFFTRFGWFRKIIGRIHSKGSSYVKRYGILGLGIYVGIPLPITGVWTGTAIAWLLGLNWKKSFLAICLGVTIATIIISVISLGIINLFSI